MPVDISVGEGGDLARVTLTGAEGLDAYLAVLRRVLAHPGLRPGAYVLTDLRENAHVMGGPEVRKLAQALLGRSADLAGRRLAVLVSKTVSYGMARMAQGLIEGAPFEVAVFYEAEAAEAWLARR